MAYMIRYLLRVCLIAMVSLPWELAAGQALPSGGNITDTIASPGQSKTYTFDANAGESVQLRITNTAGEMIPRFTVSAPGGSTLPSNGMDVMFAVPLAGTYTVKVSDLSSSRSKTGSFDLFFVKAPGSNEGGSLTNSGRRDGVIEPASDLDSYTFTAAAGEGIWLRVGDTNASDLMLPRFYVFGPTGAQVTSSPAGDLRFSAPTTGVYTVVVSDFSSNRSATGPYSLYFVRAPGANEGGALINGGKRAGTIDPGDLDTYTFKAGIGDTVTLRVSNAGGALLPSLAAYDPSGREVAAPNSSLGFSATTVGTYSVVIADFSSNRNAAGSYTVDFTISPKRRLSYAALGDSYGSGEGVRPYTEPDAKIISGCHRSARAFSQFIRVPGTTTPISERYDATFDFFACSGATTDNVRPSGEIQYDEPGPQMWAGNAINGSRDLVTISIGGNDAEFAKIVGYCFAHPDCHNLKPFGTHSSITVGDFVPIWLAYVKGKVVDLFSTLKAATANATVLTFGYPILLSGRECLAAGSGDFKLSTSEQLFLRGANQQLNTAISQAASEVGLHFVSVAEHFDGHEICGRYDDWIAGIVPFPPKTSFHPTSRGQYEYSRVANHYLQSRQTGWAHGYHSTGLPKNPPAISPTMAQASVRRQDVPPSLPSFGPLKVALQSVPSYCPSGADVLVPGRTAVIAGSGFRSGETVTIKIVANGVEHSTGTVAVAANGDLNTVVTVPAAVPVGETANVEVLGAGNNGAGRLLSNLVRVDALSPVDSDGDGIPDSCDNCPTTPNPDQADADGDGKGDVCDACPIDPANDEDGDGKCANMDACPLDPDNDIDGDGVCGNVDNCPLRANTDQADSNKDGIGDACQTTCLTVTASTRAGVVAKLDQSPANCQLSGYFPGTVVKLRATPPTGQSFTGWTGGASSRDNPLQLTLTASQAVVANFCTATQDTDGDMIADACDNCPSVANSDQADANANGVGDACEASPGGASSPGGGAITPSASGGGGVIGAWELFFLGLGVLAMWGSWQRHRPA